MRKVACESTPSNVEGASYAKCAAIQHVSVDHCSIEIFMPEQFLNCPYVVSGFQQMRGEAMTKRMATGVFDDARGAYRLLDCFLKHSFAHMVSSFDTGTWVNRSFSGWKDVLPPPFSLRIRIFFV